ncbi:MAG: hypothetical protein Q8N91_05330 [Candidatus Omnitrophota bacterium]|nr:hypothetical protein [Candidatus Omnitrophota bacterium]
MDRILIQRAEIIIMALIVLICVLLGGCADIPLKEGGLEITKDTIAGIEDLGVASITKQF